MEHLPARVTVSVGVAFVGLYNIDDRAQAWEADYYLYEAWAPTPGFTPQTELINETSSHDDRFDETVFEAGRCERTRPLHSVLHSPFDLRLFPFDRQRLTLRLADLPITVCHLPPSTIKWNKVEHRLFSFISQNWRGKPLVTHQFIVSLIAATSTKTGLRVRNRIDSRVYSKGRRISDQQLAEVHLEPHAFHGEWNYTILPAKAA